MMRHGATLWILLAATVLVAAPVLGQLPTEMEPEVTFEAVTVEEPVPADGTPTEVPLTATVGCSGAEAPETENRAVFTVDDPPTGLSVGLEPSTVTWTSSAGDCGPNATSRQVNVTATVTVRSQLPALTPVTLGLELVVEKTPPTGQNETYGPYNASLTVTPDYLGRFAVDLADTTVEVPSNETATFVADIRNNGNGETRYTASLRDLGESLVDPGEQTVVLPAGANGSLSIEISLEDPGIDSLSTHTAELVVTGVSTADEGASAGNETRTLTARFEPVDGGSGVPGPGAGLLATLLAGTALALRRR